MSRKAPITPSSYQAAIFSWVETGTGNLVVEAVAGSGKTTTMVESLMFIPAAKRVSLVAFNNPIAKELKVRVQELHDDRGRDVSRVQAGTFHSFGFRALARHLATIGEPDDNKVRNIFRDKALPGRPEWEGYESFCVKLVGLAKGEGLGMLVPADIETWERLIHHHDLELDGDELDEMTAIRIANRLLNLSNDAAKLGSIDFNDMIYLPVLWQLKMFKVDWLIVDECQDTNPVRRALMRMMANKFSRVIAVGDRRQGIFGFTGASADAMDLIKSDFRAAELPLSVSYRCKPAIVAQAQTIVPHILAAPGAEGGVVETRSLKDTLGVLDAHDAILCRAVAPLVSLAMKLLADKRGCVVLGRDIGAGLVALIKQQKAKGIEMLDRKLAAYRQRECDKFLAQGNEAKAEAVNDKVASINALIDGLGESERTIPALIARIESLFKDENGVLTLSSQHKAKGKEWERVAILEPERNPSKWVRQDWQIEQEQNLMYVAWTRAKSHLIFING